MLWCVSNLNNSNAYPYRYWYGMLLKKCCTECWSGRLILLWLLWKICRRIGFDYYHSNEIMCESCFPYKSYHQQVFLVFTLSFCGFSLKSLSLCHSLFLFLSLSLFPFISRVHIHPLHITKTRTWAHDVSPIDE